MAKLLTSAYEVTRQRLERQGIKEEEIKEKEVIKERFHFKIEGDGARGLRVIEKSERGSIKRVKSGPKTRACLNILLKECKIESMEGSNAIYAVDSQINKVRMSSVYMGGGSSVCKHTEWSRIELSDESIIEEANECEIDIHGGKMIVVGRGSRARLIKEGPQIKVKSGGELWLAEGVGFGDGRITVEEGASIKIIRKTINKK